MYPILYRMYRRIFDTVSGTTLTMTCSFEAKNLNNSSRQRLGDIFIPEFDIYGDAYLDVSVINMYYS
jgi:hypothetical protein